MAMRTFFSAVTLAACGIFSLAASGAEKKNLTVVPEAFKEKVARSRDWARRTNPLFALSAEGMDDIHLAYEGEAAPVLEAIEKYCGKEKAERIPVYVADHDIVVDMTGYALVRGLWMTLRRRPEISVEEFCRDKKRITKKTKMRLFAGGTCKWIKARVRAYRIVNGKKVIVK